MCKNEKIMYEAMIEKSKRTIIFILVQLLWFNQIACGLAGTLHAIMGPSQKEAELFYASSRGDTDKILDLIANGVNINATEWEGETPLMYAASAGQNNAVSLLIGRGADIDKKSNNGETALGRAVAGGRVETVKLLIEHGANVEKQGVQGGTPLMASTDIRITKILLEHRADPNAVNDFGITPLMAASGLGNIDIVKALVESGADIGAKDHNGWDALQWAVDRNHQEIIVYLKQQGVKR